MRAAAMLLLAVCAAAHAQYPEKPLRLVVGFTAGGPTDLPARFIADRLGASLGQRVVVENRPGAAGQIATQDVLSRPRDGYHLLLCTHFEAINVAIYKSVAYLDQVAQDIWFENCGDGYDLWELSRHYAKFDQTISILWCTEDELPVGEVDRFNRRADDEDDGGEELTGELSWGKRTRKR